MPRVNAEEELVPATERFSVSDLTAALSEAPTPEQTYVWNIRVVRPHNMITGNYARHLKTYFKARNAIVLGKRALTEARLGTRAGSCIAVLGPASLFPPQGGVEPGKSGRIVASDAACELLGRLTHLNTTVVYIDGTALSAESTQTVGMLWSDIGALDAIDAPSAPDYGELAVNTVGYIITGPAMLWSAARYYLSA
jgi:hypothetical protein